MQRPRSALHTGDFTDDSVNQKYPRNDISTVPGPCAGSFLTEALSPSPSTPWFTPSSSFSGFVAGAYTQSVEKASFVIGQRPVRSRAPSLGSYSSSYVLKAPTTPLVQQSNNTDLDFSPMELSTSPSKANRRHTLPPYTLQSLQSSQIAQHPALTHDARHLVYHRGGGLAHQRHHPRRSLTSNWSLQTSKSPQAPGFLRPRKASYSESSPLQNASMVGSFEESILRGSMSTAPSKPFNFTAQIGVLGNGSCKPKCPAHVTIPFPAVFYSWGDGGRSQTLVDDEPSPYVGHIDIQNSLLPAEPTRSPERHAEGFWGNAEYGPRNATQFSDFDNGITLHAKKSKKRRRTSSPAQVPLGGSYRIPEQGQLQIVIKNPNKTAVKLFLVPYDLTGMEAGTKTFVRQRCYSTEPVDGGILAVKPITHQSAALNRSPLSKKRPTLRYLIHLNICSPSKGRFYLYQHIRVVFANRVPDNKERLQTDIQIPQPRYSPYKPGREIHSGASHHPSVRDNVEKAYRLRSSGFGFPVDSLANDSIHFPIHAPSRNSPMPSIPYSLSIPISRERSPTSAEIVDFPALETGEILCASTASSEAIQSPSLGGSNNKLGTFNTLLLSSACSRNSCSGNDEGYGKLSKGDEGYGGFFGRPETPDPGEGLLARKLRGLGVRREDESSLSM